jgi:hypothetical protein
MLLLTFYKTTTTTTTTESGYFLKTSFSTPNYRAA